jgi:hypothetical protein
MFDTMFSSQSVRITGQCIVADRSEGRIHFSRFPSFLGNEMISNWQGAKFQRPENAFSTAEAGILENAFPRKMKRSSTALVWAALQLSLFGAAVSQQASGWPQMEWDIPWNRFSQPRLILWGVQRKKG